MGNTFFVMDVAGLSVAIVPYASGFGAFASRYGKFSSDSALSNACDFRIEVTPGMIAREREQADSPAYSDAYLQTLAVQRAIAEELPRHGRFLMHAAVVEYGGKAYAFTAPSGTGKSTHVRLWRKAFGDNARIINGDKPFIWIPEDDACVEAFGSPWCGKEGWNENAHAPLAGVCLIERGDANECVRVAAADSLDWLGHQVYMPKNTESGFLTLGLLDALMRKVPLFRLSCDMTTDAVRASFEAMASERFSTHCRNTKEAVNAKR